MKEMTRISRIRVGQKGRYIVWSEQACLKKGDQENKNGDQKNKNVSLGESSPGYSCTIHDFILGVFQEEGSVIKIFREYS